jgi:glutathione S-transferase
MKLFYSPGACSLSPHIVLREAGLKVDIEKVDTKAGKTASGADFRALNPKGYVPALQLDDGSILTEGAVIVQYLADKKGDGQLVPKAGTDERYRLQEWLTYIATEIHKGFGLLWNKNLAESTHTFAREALEKKFDFLARNLEGKQFLLGDRFTVADAYLFTVLNWTNFLNIDLSRWSPLKTYLERIGSRPAVRDAMRAEGLLK